MKTIIFLTILTSITLVQCCQVLDERNQIPPKIDSRYSVFSGKVVGFTKPRKSFPFFWRYHGMATGVIIDIDSVYYTKRKINKKIEVYSFGVTTSDCRDIGFDSLHYMNDYNVGNEVKVVSFKSRRIKRYIFRRGHEFAAHYRSDESKIKFDKSNFDHFLLLSNIERLTDFNEKADCIKEHLADFVDRWGQETKRFTHGIIYLNLGLSKESKSLADICDIKIEDMLRLRE